MLHKDRDPHARLAGRWQGYDLFQIPRAILRKLIRRRASESRRSDHWIGKVYFDRDYYLRIYPDVAAAGIDPLEHFVQYGEAEGRRPNLLFDPGYYLERYPDVTASGLSAIRHYALYGEAERRQPHPWFDPNFYESQLPQSARTGLGYIEHYLRHGAVEGLRTSQLFDSDFYTRQVAGRTVEKGTALIDFLTYADSSPHPVFDPDYYSRVNPDVLAARISPFEHYARHGVRRNYSISAFFDPHYYQATYQTGRNVNALAHYLEHGLRAGCVPNSRASRNGLLYSFVSQTLEAGEFSRAIHQDRQILAISNLDWVRSVAAPVQRVAVAAPKYGSLPMPLRPQEEAVVCPPVIFGQEINPEPFKAKLPDLYVATVDNVVCVVGTNLVVTSDGAILHDELAEDPDGQYGVKIGIVRAFRSGKALFHAPIINEELTEAILLSCDADANYYHWMFEVLPKLMLLDQCGVPAEVPLIVTSEAHPNFLELLARVAPTRAVLRFPHQVGLKVKKLWVPGNLSRVLSNYKNPVDPGYDIVLSPSGLKYVYDRLRPAHYAVPSRRLYLTRPRGIRRALNEEVLIGLLRERNFEVVDPSGLSIDEQRETFASAELIVGPTGAAMTNLIFAHPEAQALIFVADHPQTNACIFSQVAQFRGIDLEFLACRRAFSISGEYSVHDDYFVDPEALVRWVDEAGRPVN